MVPIDLNDKPIVLANVFFDLSKSTLRKESYVELNKLVEFLEKNKTIHIEIGGHTDSRGDEIKNNTLSQNRAKSVKDYLISKGIESTRLSAVGYAATKPVYTDEEIAKLTDNAEQEAAHQSNRRTEYKIVK